MRDYAKVSPQFWIGETGRKLRAAGLEVQFVALYLMTAPHANMLGLYYLPLAYIAHETGLAPDAALDALRKCEAAGFCRYDEAAEVAWVYEMARFQIGDELHPTDKRCKGAQREYLAVPENVMLGAFFDRYAPAFHMDHRRGEEAPSKPHASPSEAPSKGLHDVEKPLRSQEQEQEQEHEQNPAAPVGALDAVWKDGLQSLMATGETEKSARGFIGMLLSKHEAEDVQDAFIAAHGKMEPRAYVRGVLKSKPRKSAAGMAILAHLREEYGPQVHLDSALRGFHDPATQRIWDLDGEPRASV